MTTDTQTAATPAAPAADATTAAATPASTDTLLTGAQPAAPAAAQPAAAPAASATDTAGSTDKPAEGAKPDEKTQGAPEQYADFTAPDGVALNAEVVGELKTLAKEHNLTQDAAQKFVDLGVKQAQRIEAGYKAQIEQAQAQWASDARIDKEFGGDKLDENLAVAGAALKQFGSPELIKMLTESGLGNHPEIIRAFYRVGKATAVDKHVTGAARPEQGDPLAKMYPTMKT